MIAAIPTDCGDVNGISMVAKLRYSLKTSNSSYARTAEFFSLLDLKIYLMFSTGAKRLQL